MSQSSTDYDAERVLDALKQILKERKISYSMIADRLDVSLPTVKRMFNKPGIPLDRLMGICRIAEVELSEVIARADTLRPTHYVFTAEQDSLFYDRPEFLDYFRELTEQGKSPDQIADEFSLNQRSTDAYLIGLSKVKLIERETGNKIRILVEPPFGFGPGSRVLQKMQSEVITKALDMVLNSKGEKWFTIFKPMNLPEDLYLELVGELSGLVSKYAYLSESSPKTKKGEGWNLSIATGPSGDQAEVSQIKNIDSY